MLRHYIPEVEEVVNHLDMIPKPGLDTPEGKAIKRVLDEEINPQIAMHGGHIALVDVVDDTAYVRLDGGCQGCAMSSLTLKQGVEGAIMQCRPVRHSGARHDRPCRRREPVLSVRQGRYEPVLVSFVHGRSFGPSGWPPRGVVASR